MPNTATKSDVRQDLDEMSARISGFVRAVALGVLAVSWGFLVTPNPRMQVAPGPVLSAIALAFLALLLDWSQYFIGYLHSKQTFDAMERDETLRGWNPSRLKDAREYLFGAKQAVTVASVVVLVAGMIPAIVRLVVQ